MAIKVDLGKAYDRLEWSFIRDTLNLFKFSTQLISFIMSCVSTSSISILFSGGALEPFHLSRGIRQGGPLSPYLFILCMEVFGALISKKCSAKLWNPVKASQGGLAFSLLFFVEDLVLFAKVDRKNCMVVRDALDTFCSLLGQKVSHEKSRVFFSPNVAVDNRADLSEILGFRSTLSLGKYLGFSIKHLGINQDFGYIIERMQNRLAGWKANLFSFAGWMVLTQAVRTTIPNYAMQCVALPSKILSSMDRIS